VSDRIYRNGRQVDADGRDLVTGADPWGMPHGCSWSSLETFLRSRKTYLRKHVLGTLETPTSPAMEFGRLVHLAVLEPDRFESETAPAPSIPRNKGPGIAAWKAYESGGQVVRGPCDSKNRVAWRDFSETLGANDVGVLPKDYEEAADYLAILEANRGKILVPPDTSFKCQAIRDSVWEHPVAHAILSKDGIKREAETKWVDQSGIEMFAHPDLIWPGGGADLKTTRDVRPEAFASSCENYGYHRQAAIYLLDAHREFYGDRGERFFHIVADSTEPYDVEVYEMDPEWIDAGVVEVREALDTLALCVEHDDWRSPGAKAGGALELMRPPWAAGKRLAYEMPVERWGA